MIGVETCPGWGLAIPKMNNDDKGKREPENHLWWYSQCFDFEVVFSFVKTFSSLSLFQPCLVGSTLNCCQSCERGAEEDNENILLESQLKLCKVEQLVQKMLPAPKW